jgi:hypothetical protein
MLHILVAGPPVATSESPFGAPQIRGLAGEGLPDNTHASCAHMQPSHALYAWAVSGVSFRARLHASVSRGVHLPQLRTLTIRHQLTGLQRTIRDQFRG